MNRRNFLTVCIATCTAPAIVRASSLMRLSVPKPENLYWMDSGGSIFEFVGDGLLKPLSSIPILNDDWMRGLQWTKDEIDRITGIDAFKPPLVINKIKEK